LIIIRQRKQVYVLLNPDGLGLSGCQKLLFWTQIVRIEAVYKTNQALAVIYLDQLSRFESADLDKRFVFDAQTNCLRFGIGQSDRFKNAREFELALQRYWQGGQARARIAELEKALDSASS